MASKLARSGYEGRISEPEVNVTDIPMKLGRWVGIEQPILDDTARVLNAHSYVNRIYRDDLGREVALHAAVWAKPDLGEIAPHHPEICYPAAGWQIMSRKVARVPLEDREFPVEFMSFQRDASSIVTGHWYQIGDSKFTDGSNLGRQLLRLWGQEVWPCTVKVLIQTNATDMESGQRTLQSFAQSLEPLVGAKSK